jgi:hypothetical protein
MRPSILNGFFDELEKIALLGAQEGGGGRGMLMARNQRAARDMVHPPMQDTAKQWMGKQMRPGGALTSPAQNAAALAKKAPVPMLSAGRRAAQAVRGVAFH